MSTEMALAMAIIRGDRTAARALADLIIEEDRLSYEQRESLKSEHRQNSTAILGFALWGVPEFRALLRVLGVSWEAATINMTIHVPMDGVVRVTQQIQARRPVE